MAVPYTFGTATAAIPLSQLDSNFATAITLGNTAVYLGNTTTSIGNLTLTNVTISSGEVTTGNVSVSGNVTLSGGTANGVAYLNGSKVLTTGSALVFDGTKLGIGTASPVTNLSIGNGGGGNDLGVFLSRGATTNFYQAYDGTKTFIAGVDSTNDFVKIGALSNHPIGFVTNNSEKLRLDTSGNLGLGVTPPTSTDAGNITIKGGSTLNFSTASGNMAANATFNSGWKYIATAAAVKYTQSGAEHQWFNAASGTAGNTISFTQAMTLDASGQLVIGDTTADTKFNLVGGVARISGTRTAGSFIDITPNNTGSNGVTLGVSYYGSGSYGPLKFSTSGVERARITSAGDLDLYVTAAKDGALRWTSGGGGALQGLIYCNGNPEVVVQSGGTGGVKLTSGATSWVSASDTRFKDIIEPIANAVDKVNTLSAVIYSFKDDETAERRVGLIAQELLAVLPEAVHVPKKEEEMMGVRYTETIPLLVAAIKEQSAIITQLQADVAALKGASA